MLNAGIVSHADMDLDPIARTAIATGQSRAEIERDAESVRASLPGRNDAQQLAAALKDIMEANR